MDDARPPCELTKSWDHLRFVIGDLRLSIFAASNLVHLLTQHCR